MKGGRVFGVLLRNEWFKARKRLAFWLPLGFYAFITFGTYAYPFLEESEGFRLPEVWTMVFGNEGVQFLIFAGLTLMLLATPEFNWRTARQNVIDGLSKSQWFWGKSLLLPFVALAFLGTHLLIPGVLALIRTDLGAATGPLVPASVFAATGGMILAFLCVGALALFVAFAIRRTGASLAIWVLWVGPIESGMLRALVMRYLPDYTDWLDYLPFGTAARLLDYRSYDTATAEAMAAAAEAAGRTVPTTPDLAGQAIAAVAWTVFFLGTAFIWFRRRDL